MSVLELGSEKSSRAVLKNTGYVLTACFRASGQVWQRRQPSVWTRTKVASSMSQTWSALPAPSVLSLHYFFEDFPCLDESVCEIKPLSGSFSCTGSGKTDKSRVWLTPEDLSCSKPKVLLSQLVQQSLQQRVVYGELFWQHEVHRVWSDREYLSVHTSLQVRVEQKSVLGDVGALWGSQKGNLFIPHFTGSWCTRTTKTYHWGLWFLAGYWGPPECLCETSSQPDVSKRESGSPDLEGHMARRRSSGTRRSLCKSRRNSWSTEKIKHSSEHNDRGCTQTHAWAAAVGGFDAPQSLAFVSAEIKTCSNKHRKMFHSCFFHRKMTVCTEKFSLKLLSLITCKMKCTQKSLPANCCNFSHNPHLSKWNLKLRRQLQQQMHTKK